MLSLVDVVGGKSAKQTGDSKPGDSTPLGNSTLSPSTGSADSDVILKPPPTHGTFTGLADLDVILNTRLIWI